MKDYHFSELDLRRAQQIAASGNISLEEALAQAALERERAKSPTDALSLLLPGGEESAVWTSQDERRFEQGENARRFLAMVATAPLTSRREIDGWLALRAAGIVRDPPEQGRALVVATADELPFDLPASGEPGRRHVVLVKETDLP